jgi:hypothetical protein
MVMSDKAVYRGLIHRAQCRRAGDDYLLEALHCAVSGSLAAQIVRASWYQKSDC